MQSVEQRRWATELPSAAEFASILNSEASAVCVLSRDGLCRFVTPSFCGMFGAERDELLGRELPPFLKQLTARPLDPALPILRDHEMTLARKNGSRFPARVRAKVLITEGPGTGSVYFVEDLTEEKHMEDVLRKTEKLASAGRMAAAIAHEINNPLEAVTNLLYLLRTEQLTPAAGRYLSLLESEVERVSRIARQTLAFYREKGRPTRVDVRELLNLSIDVHTMRNPAVRVHRRYRTSETIPGFSSELQQVFHNLVSNAIEAGATELFLHTRHCTESVPPHRRGICVTVGDNGSGIDAAVREQLFHPFFTTKGDRGTGLGLWTSRGIILRHEGTIRLRTATTPSRSGTCFMIFLPS